MQTFNVSGGWGGGIVYLKGGLGKRGRELHHDFEWRGALSTR